MSTSLHILTGDSTRRGLEGSGVPGETLVWADVLYEGPVLSALGTAEFRRVRAEYLSGAGYGQLDDILDNMRRIDDRLARLDEYDEVVWWFEHDLFDQLLLVSHLARLSTDRAAFRRARLISVDRHLGMMSPSELAALYPSRQPLAEAQVALGVEVWQAFCAATPNALDALADRGPSPDLPYLAGALSRLLEEYPARTNGLSRSETQLLRAVAEGYGRLSDAFRAAQTMEGRVFMGDASFWRIARLLAEAKEPLLTLEADDGPHLPPGALPDAIATLTPLGWAVLQGHADHVAINGVDRWIGGVHLQGHGPLWRHGGTPVI